MKKEEFTVNQIIDEINRTPLDSMHEDIYSIKLEMVELKRSIPHNAGLLIPEESEETMAKVMAYTKELAT
jgi:hypothetical protein